MQRDIFFDTLTVRQELEFALRLRTSGVNIEKKMAEVVTALGLEKVLDSKIGSSVERGLSGGEIKRLNIGVELFITNAAMCLLDEPLTGLDSSRAFTVLSTLRHRATSGVSGVLLSIHQPSSKIWALFDRLLLLAPRGRVVYDGSAEPALDYFNSIGHAVPFGWNPPDHFIELISFKDGQEDDLFVDTIVQAWRERPDNDALILKKAGVMPEVKAQLTFQMAPFGIQVNALTRRAFVNLRRTILKPLRWAMVLTLAGIFGWLWFSTARTKKERGHHAADLVSIVYMIVAQWSWGPSLQTVGLFPAEREVLTKELASQAYSIEAYFLSKQIAEVPISMLLPLVFHLVLFPLVGLPWIAFPATYAVTLLHSWISTSSGIMLSALVFDTETTATMLIVANIFQQVSSGFFIDIMHQGPGISWVRFISYWYYTTGALLKIVALPYDDHYKEIHWEVKDYSFSKFPVWIDILILFGYGLILRTVAFFALKYSPKIRFA